MLSIERVKELINDPNLSDEQVEKIRNEIYSLSTLIFDQYREEIKLHKEYIAKRNKYKPENLKAIFILESPPKSGKYFYDPEGETTEPLFKAMMELIGCKPTDKASGLVEFAKKGFIIVDATYTPVNHYKEGKERDQAIMIWRSTLLKDLEILTPNKKTPIVLVKANICRLFAGLLKSAGFNVINNGITIPFPATGQQGRFRKQIASVLKDADINPEA